MQSRTNARRAIAVVAAAAATIGFGAFSASAALAADGEPIYGSGASLQASAHLNSWIQGWTTGPPPVGGLTGSPSVTYTSTNSGGGLDEFGNNTAALDKSQDPTAGPLNLLDAFTGTDAPPSPAQLTNAATAGGSAEITIPVAQAPVAILLSLPTGVTVTGSVSLSNSAVQQAFSCSLPPAGGYNANTFGALLSATGVTASFSATTASNSGNAPITIEIRDGDSGTSFATKDYMSQVAGLQGLSPNPWSGLVDDHETWPTACTGRTKDNEATPSGFGVNSGGSALVRNVAATPERIGYANLADAVNAAVGAPFTNTATATTFGPTGNPSPSHQIVYALIENDGLPGLGTPSYADPIVTSTSCTANVSSSGVGSWTNVPGSITTTTSWSAVTASNPAVGGTFYPLVAATYVLAWNRYSQVPAGNYIDNQRTFDTVKSYLTWVVGHSPGACYAAVPGTVAARATSALALVTFP